MFCTLLSIVAVTVTAFLAHPHAAVAQTPAGRALAKPAVAVTVNGNTPSANGLEAQPGIGAKNHCAHHRPRVRLSKSLKSPRSLSIFHQWWACPDENLWRAHPFAPPLDRPAEARSRLSSLAGWDP